MFIVIQVLGVTPWKDSTTARLQWSKVQASISCQAMEYKNDDRHDNTNSYKEDDTEHSKNAV